MSRFDSHIPGQLVCLCLCDLPHSRKSAVCLCITGMEAEDMEEEVLAMVVRTGLNTCMGDMIRQIISPACESKERDPLLKVTCLQC